MATENLWPENLKDTLPVQPDAPVRILHEQAEYLGERLDGSLSARIKSSSRVRKDLPHPSSMPPLVEMEHAFCLVVPEIDYEYPLFIVFHGPKGYPLRVQSSLGSDAQCNNEQEFKELLRGIFNHDTTRKAIAELLILSGEEAVAR